MPARGSIWLLGRRGAAAWPGPAAMAAVGMRAPTGGLGGNNASKGSGIIRPLLDSRPCFLSCSTVSRVTLPPCAESVSGALRHGAL